MKFSKLILVCLSLGLTASLMAYETVSDNSEPEQKDTHTCYWGYEFGVGELSYPSIGYRYQKDDYIFDINGGYKYVEYLDIPLHVYKTGINFFRSIYKTKVGQLYAGVGGDFYAPVFKGRSDYSFLPSLSMGQDFNIHNEKKVFFELSYKPYCFGKYENNSAHIIGCKVGIGF